MTKFRSCFIGKKSRKYLIHIQYIYLIYFCQLLTALFRSQDLNLYRIIFFSSAYRAWKDFESGKNTVCVMRIIQVVVNSNINTDICVPSLLLREQVIICIRMYTYE